MRALLQGSPGRSPFAGHFRGRVAEGGAELAWAGRVKGSAAPEEAWAAAEAAREAMTTVRGSDRFALIDSAWAALRNLNRPDISLLLVASDAEGLSLAASGLGDLRLDGEPVAEPDHPLFDEPGVRERPGYFHPPRVGNDWVGVPVGVKFAPGDVDLTCGARNVP